MSLLPALTMVPMLVTMAVKLAKSTGGTLAVPWPSIAPRTSAPRTFLRLAQRQVRALIFEARLLRPLAGRFAGSGRLFRGLVFIHTGRLPLVYQLPPRGAGPAPGDTTRRPRAGPPPKITIPPPAPSCRT
jgi:hypothetical protein